MSSKEYYYVPVYVMLAEDFVCGDVDFMFLDKIIVSKTKTGYEELDGFNNFVILKSERDESKKLNIVNYDECLYLNEDDITEENRVMINHIFNRDNYVKDNFDNFIKMKREKIKVLGGNRWKQEFIKYLFIW